MYKFQLLVCMACENKDCYSMKYKLRLHLLNRRYFLDILHKVNRLD